MDQDMLKAAAALRDKAYATFKAFDDAVVSLGGASRITPKIAANSPAGRAIVGAVGERLRRQTQAGAAEEVLSETGSPMTVHQLMEAVPSKGVTLGGADPQVNFTSSLSKSGKFRSVRQGGNYWWWFKDKPLPEDWQEAPDLLSKEGSDASVVGNGNQEGGDGHAATMPN